MIRLAIACLALIALFPGAGSGGTATLVGASITGGKASPPAWPMHFATLGDVQIGSYCDRWAAHETDGDENCGAAQVARAQEFVDYAQATYQPKLWAVVGDMTNTTQPWQEDLYRDFLDSLPRHVYKNMEHVCGNHDVLSTCGWQERFMTDAFDQASSATYPGAVERPPFWSRQVEGKVRVVGFCTNLMTWITGAYCLDGSRTARCWGNPLTPEPGDGDTLDICTTHTGATGCKSGKCGLLQDLRSQQETFLDEQRALSDIDEDVALVNVSHMKYCSSGSATCDNVGTTLPLDAAGISAFNLNITDMMHCSTDGGGDPDLFCTTTGSATHGCGDVRTGGTGETCSEWATGFLSRTDLLARLQDIEAPVVSASGHIGTWTRNAGWEDGWSALGTTVFDFVAIGAWDWKRIDTGHVGHVFSVDHDGTVTFIEAYHYVNTPSVILKPEWPAGTLSITTGDLPYVLTLKADDADYPDFTWSIPDKPACMTFADNTGNVGEDVNELYATLTVEVACGAGSFGPMTITVDDDGVAGDAVTAPLTVVVSP